MATAMDNGFWVDGRGQAWPTRAEAVAVDMADVAACAIVLRRIAGPYDSHPEGALKRATTASVQTLNKGIHQRDRIGSPELRMKHYVRIRAALLAIAEDLEGIVNG